MAHTGLVSHLEKLLQGHTSLPPQHGPVSATPANTETPPEDNEDDVMSLVKQAYSMNGLSKDVLDILMASWRGAPKSSIVSN